MTRPVEIFNIADGTWKTKITKGKPPLGVSEIVYVSLEDFAVMIAVIITVLMN